MRREDIQKLLGGYATNTLTPEERQTLFEAALEDQTVFDALAGEEALRETLDDPQCRRRIERALEEQPEGWLQRMAAAMRTPRLWALGATLAAAVVIGVVAIQVNQKPEPEVQMARRAAVEAPPSAPHSPTAGENAAAPEPARSAGPAKMDALRARPQQLAAPPIPASPTAPVVTAALSEESESRAKEKGRDLGLPASMMADRKVSDMPVTVGVGGQVANAPPPPSARAEAVTQLPRGNEGASMARQNQVANWAGQPRQMEQRADKSALAATKPAENAALSGALAPAPPPVRYTLLPLAANGSDKLEKDSRAGPTVRIALESTQSGFLYAMGGKDLLMSAYAVPGKRYLVDPRPQDKEIIVILSPVPESGDATVFTGLGDSHAKDETKARTRSVLRIPLPRP